MNTTTAALSTITANFPVGCIVSNFGQTAKVDGYQTFDADGSVMLICRPYPAMRGVGRWIAKPALCERLDAPQTVVAHRDGFVTFG